MVDLVKTFFVTWDSLDARKQLWLDAGDDATSDSYGASRN